MSVADRRVHADLVDPLPAGRYDFAVFGGQWADGSAR